MVAVQLVKLALCEFGVLISLGAWMLLNSRKMFALGGSTWIG